MSVDITVHSDIQRSAADIFAYVTHVEHDPVWTSGLLEVRVLTEGEIAPGTRFERVSKFLGRRMTYVIDVVELVPDERLLMRTSSGPFPMEITYTVSPLGDGRTRFSIRAKGDPGGFFSLVGPLMSRQVARQIQLDVDTLKEVLEAQA